MARSTFVYEMSSGECYGYFSGCYLYTMNGVCSHYRSVSDGKYLYQLEEGDCEFYQSGKYFYTMEGGDCRWYLS